MSDSVAVLAVLLSVSDSSTGARVVDIEFVAKRHWGSPLCAAARSDSARAARLLLAHGANLYSKDNEWHCTPFACAIEAHSDKVVRLFTRHHIQNKNSRSDVVK